MSEAAPSSRRAVGCVGKRLSFPCHLFTTRAQRDLRPSLTQTNGLAHATEKLLFAVKIMPPAAAFIELDKMCKPTLGKGAPFLGDLVERMGG
jgi:hypothetical protein